MIPFLLAGIIPAIFLVEIGKSRRPIQGKPESFPSWAGFLSIGLGLLIGTTVLAFAMLGESGSLLILLFLPSICALQVRELHVRRVRFRDLETNRKSSQLRDQTSRSFGLRFPVRPPPSGSTISGKVE